MVYHPRQALYIGTTHRHNSVNKLYAFTYVLYMLYSNIRYLHILANTYEIHSSIRELIYVHI